MTQFCRPAADGLAPGGADRAGALLSAGSAGPASGNYVVTLGSGGKREGRAVLAKAGTQVPMSDRFVEQGLELFTERTPPALYRGLNSQRQPGCGRPQWRAGRVACVSSMCGTW